MRRWDLEVSGLAPAPWATDLGTDPALVQTSLGAVRGRPPVSSPTFSESQTRREDSVELYFLKLVLQQARFLKCLI